MKDHEYAQMLAEGAYRGPDFAAKPCSWAEGCSHSGICLVDNKVYCGTHAWDLRYATRSAR